MDTVVAIMALLGSVYLAKQSREVGMPILAQVIVVSALMGWGGLLINEMFEVDTLIYLAPLFVATTAGFFSMWQMKKYKVGPYKKR